jgi:hypothetical protein
MFTKLPRRVFQIDGLNGGLLSIAERPNETRVLLIIGNGEKEAQISLSREDYAELADLKYSLRFADPAEPQDDTETALKAVA